MIDWLNHSISLAGLLTTPLEILGFLTGAICVYLNTRQNVLGWFFGIINAVLYAAVFWQVRIVRRYGFAGVLFSDEHLWLVVVEIRRANARWGQSNIHTRETISGIRADFHRNNHFLGLFTRPVYQCKPYLCRLRINHCQPDRPMDDGPKVPRKLDYLDRSRRLLRGHVLLQRPASHRHFVRSVSCFSSNWVCAVAEGCC
jgi:hypothetical protein